MATFIDRKPNDSNIYHGCMISLENSLRTNSTRPMVIDGMKVNTDNRKPAAGKSIVARRTRRIPQPLDWAANDERQAESEHQHADDANEHRGTLKGI